MDAKQRAHNRAIIIAALKKHSPQTVEEIASATGLDVDAVGQDCTVLAITHQIRVPVWGVPQYSI